MLTTGLVHTCIVCRRDVLPVLPDPHPDFDFVCHTDEPDLYAGRGWHTKRLHHHHEGATLTARWHKMHPHRHSPGYGVYIWVDGHFAPRRLLTELVREMGTADLAAFRHRARYDPYQEARFLLDRGKEPAPACAQALRLLRESRYPSNGGLHETGILLARNTTRVTRLLEDWWTALEAGGGCRDQLHFDRVVREHGLKLYEPQGESRANAYFDWTFHSQPSRETHHLRERWTASPSDQAG